MVKERIPERMTPEAYDLAARHRADYNPGFWYVVRNRYTKVITVINQPPRKIDKRLAVLGTREEALLVMDAEKQKADRREHIKAVLVVVALGVVIFLAIKYG